jgi:hypothetical protein
MTLPMVRLNVFIAFIVCSFRGLSAATARSRRKNPHHVDASGNTPATGALHRGIWLALGDGNAKACDHDMSDAVCIHC